MTEPLGLNALISALRTAGLPIGYTEIARLQQVFNLQPTLPEDDAELATQRLKSVLRAVLVKDKEQHKLFERVFNTWLAQAEQAHRIRQQPDKPKVSTPDIPPPADEPAAVPLKTRLQRTAPWLLVGLISLALVVVVINPFSGTTTVAPPPVTTTPPVARPVSHDPLTASELRQKEFESWHPVFGEIQNAPTYWTGWPYLLLSALSLAFLWGLWQLFKNKTYINKPDPDPPPGKGPPRVFLQPPQLKEPQLLDARQQETLVWGIGRFAAEEFTPKLDLATTVNATAKQGGIPTLHFQRAYYQREVWLWLDDAADDTAIERLADEVTLVLEQHGLTVERASFRGIPERLITTDGAVFAPREIDERRELALVAILTDGRLLTRQYRASDRRVQINAVLRDLSHWPRLAFIDFGAEHHDLTAIVNQHGLECLAPQQIATFFGGGQIAATTPEYDLTPWAAACALSPAPIDGDTALQLRRELKLAGSSWGLSKLQVEAPGPAGRLLWPVEQRAQYLNWLYSAEAHPRDEIDSNSLLHRALNFWETRYAAEDEKRQQEHNISPWQNTPAKQHWRMERELLRLWREPEKAAENLYKLFQERLKSTITQHLGQFAPQGSKNSKLIQLPWQWRSISARHQVMLQEMGLGGQMAKVHLERPGRLWIGLSTCAGLATAAVTMAMLSDNVAPEGPPVLQHTNEKPIAAEQFIESLPDNQWRVTVTAPKWLKEGEVKAKATVPVTWERNNQQCVESLDADAELWRCGAATTPAQLSEKITRSLMVIAANPKQTAVEDLASALLAGGSADLVLVAKEWKEHLPEITGKRDRLNVSHQFLLISSDTTTTMLPSGTYVAHIQTTNWATLTNRLRFNEGTSELKSMWPDVNIVSGDPSNFLLKGIGFCQPKEEIDEYGITFVRLCPDKFTMGDDNWIDSAKPSRTVTINAFSIMQTEVTIEQYQRVMENNTVDDKRPQVRINWRDAKAFCEKIDARLPTEAEWEYAARAGSTTHYSFGDDESELERYGWYDKNSNDKAQPVATLEPNDWGLYDMHGNVYEWVQDCWNDNYQGAPNDGSAWEEGKCDRRVLRGGAFDDGAGNLRSAFRYGNWPGGVIRVVGFRCARGLRHQP